MCSSFSYQSCILRRRRQVISRRHSYSPAKMPFRCMLNPYSTKHFLASLDFCCAGEHPTNTRPRNQAPNLFKETHVEQRKRWCQWLEVGQFWWRARTSHVKHKPRLSPQKRNCRPYFVGKELNYTEHTKKVANCMISQFQLYLLSGFVRKNKATKRVEIFQRSPFLRLWNDLQKRSGKWISR